MPRPVKHQARLLVGCLRLDETHAWPLDGFTDRLGIRGIILLTLQIGLHVGRRHQSNGMTESLQFT